MPYTYIDDCWVDRGTVRLKCPVCSRWIATKGYTRGLYRHRAEGSPKRRGQLCPGRAVPIPDTEQRDTQKSDTGKSGMRCGR